MDKTKSLMPTQKLQAVDKKVSAASAPEVLENLVRLAERAGASDIHLQMRGKSAEVGFRLDGIITPGTRTARGNRRARLWPHQISRAAENVSGNPAAGRPHCARRTQKQKRHPRRHLPDRHRRKNCPAAVQFRNSVKTLDEIDFARKRARSELEKFLRQTTGLLLLTGPAGSGKTTTIYACLRHLGRTRRTPHHHRRRPGGANCSRHDADGNQRSHRPRFCPRRAAFAAAGPAGAHHRRNSRRSHRATRRPRRADRASGDFHAARRFVQAAFLNGCWRCAPIIPPWPARWNWF